jgi:hypothetical protein
VSFKLNVFTGVLDITGISQTQADLRYLKLDQTTPQNVINGSPEFDEGLTIKATKPLYLDGA